MQFLDKLSIPVVGAWCSWPDSAENCGYAAFCSADRGVSCHRSWGNRGSYPTFSTWSRLWRLVPQIIENRESDSAFAMRSRSWRLVPLIMEMSRSWRLVPQIMEVDVSVVQVHLKGRILRHFWFIVEFFWSP